MDFDSMQMIKCKFCDWQTKVWTTTKKGKKASGYRRLKKHVAYLHENIGDEIGDWLNQTQEPKEEREIDW